MIPGMRAVRAAIVLGAVAIPGVVVAATAPPATAHLSWVRATGAETCIDGTALAREVSRRLGRDAFGGTPSRSIEGVVARADKGWVAHLYVREPDGALLGERALTSEAADCASLSSAVTLAVALAIDPEAALAPPPASASVAASASAVSSASVAASVAPRAPLAPPEVPSPPPIVAPPPPSPANADLRAGLVTGLAPSTGPAFVLSVGGRGVLHPRVGALFVPAQRTSDGVAAIGLVAGTFGGCASLAEDDAVALDACAALLAGRVHASAFGVPALPPAERTWLGLDTGVDARVRLRGPLLLSAGLGAVWPFTRHDFRIEGRDAGVFRQPFVGLLATAGLGVRF
ncbi:MAG: hypothetical protein NVS3B10_16070 [Polyangiales bacterium]